MVEEDEIKKKKKMEIKEEDDFGKRRTRNIEVHKNPSMDNF